MINLKSFKELLVNELSLNDGEPTIIYRYGYHRLMNKSIGDKLLYKDIVFEWKGEVYRIHTFQGGYYDVHTSKYIDDEVIVLSKYSEPITLEECLQN